MKKKKIQVIDLFCGAGGLSWGFAAHRGKQCEFELIGAVDFNPDSLATYRRNIECDAVVQQDLSAIAASKSRLIDFVRSFNIDRSLPLVIVGGPPCQGFSAHSKKQRKTTDTRNGLVAAFAKIALAFDPDLIAFENVPEAMTEKNWAHFRPMVNLFRRQGFSMEAKVHNLAEYGVPQERFRALLIASKSGTMPELVPTHDSERFISVRQAIGHLEPVKPGEIGLDPMHFCANHRNSTVETIKQVPRDGGSRPPGVGPKCLAKVDGYRDVYGRLAWDRPAVTVTASARNPASGRFSHPEQDRGLTVREAALLQGFPHNFIFEGSFDEKFLQIGNAVPPRFSLCLAEAVAKFFARTAKHIRPVEGTYQHPLPLRNSFSSAIFAYKRRGEDRYAAA